MIGFYRDQELIYVASSKRLCACDAPHDVREAEAAGAAGVSVREPTGNSQRQMGPRSYCGQDAEACLGST
jgi:hypothetical protein